MLTLRTWSKCVIMEWEGHLFICSNGTQLKANFQADRAPHIIDIAPHITPGWELNPGQIGETGDVLS